jgi:gliding motility-associated-like protein
MYGCNASDDVEVSKDCYIDIPNTFTPNNDGVNDYFFPRRFLSAGAVGFDMQVFNRWGQIVFATNNVNGRGWDGKFNGKEQPQGVYIYMINVVFKNARTEKYTGNVTLLR